MAFSKPVRTEMKERANGASELTNEQERPLVCAHNQHQRGRKRKERFDYAENGFLVTDIEHLAQHTLFKVNPERLGLPTDQNDVAILLLTQDSYEFNKKNKIPEDIVREHFKNAIKAWIDLLYEDPTILKVSQKENDEIITTIIQNINKLNKEERLPLVGRIDEWG